VITSTEKVTAVTSDDLSGKKSHRTIRLYVNLQKMNRGRRLECSSFSRKLSSSYRTWYSEVWCWAVL